MKQLYDELTATEVINNIADEVMDIHNVSKAKARKLVLNALVYNCVIEEVLGQVDFLLDKD